MNMCFAEFLQKQTVEDGEDYLPSNYGTHMASIFLGAQERRHWRERKLMRRYVAGLRGSGNRRFGKIRALWVSVCGSKPAKAQEHRELKLVSEKASRIHPKMF